VINRNVRKYPSRMSEVWREYFCAIELATSSVRSGEFVDPRGEYACGTMPLDLR
jgi:hypothetical protein